MPRLRKDGSQAKRTGRKRKIIAETIVGDQTTITLKETAPGKFVPEKSGPLIPVALPKNIAPADYLTRAQMVIIGRIERLAREGKPEDIVKLKANFGLLNKIMPDVVKGETREIITPYDRICAALKKEEEKDGTEVTLLLPKT